MNHKLDSQKLRRCFNKYLSQKLEIDVTATYKKCVQGAFDKEGYMMKYHARSCTIYEHHDLKYRHIFDI